jgi:hypothetical protein
MQSINVISLAPEVNSWLANSCAPRILHVFDGACNLINEHREVLSIVTPQLGNGPFNLVVENKVLFSRYLNIESPILIQENQLSLGELAITTSNAQVWNPDPDWKTLHAKRHYIAQHLTQLPVTNYLKSPGLLDHQNFQTTQSLTLAPYASAGVSNLTTALATADLRCSLTAAIKLAGLGAGLTPAGDDFLLGALHAAWIIHPLEAASVLSKEIVDAIVPLTTSLSAEWLRSAGKGDAGVLWHEFFDALSLGDPVLIRLQVTKLLSVGHTSGADALAGFFGTFLYYMRNPGFPHYNRDGFRSFISKATWI